MVKPFKDLTIFYCKICGANRFIFQKSTKNQKKHYQDYHEISRLLSESESPQASEELSSSSGDSKLEEE